MEDRPQKPLGIKNYGHIPHLPGSRLGVGDHKCDAGLSRIATLKPRDRHDRIIVQEKLDGSNVGVARLDGKLYALSRAGYLADTSPYQQHWLFSQWVYQQQDRFLAVLKDGERLCGEWLAQAHSTRYDLNHEPFVAFDLMRGQERTTLTELIDRLQTSDFVLPHLLHQGGAFSIESALEAIATSGHGAIDPVEGAVWRVERNELIRPGQSGDRVWRVDFLVKYVRPDKQDGIFLPELSGQNPVWNWQDWKNWNR